MQTSISVISVLVTILGFAAAFGSLLVLTRGKKLPRERNEPQRIKYKDLEITTDRIGMLFIAGLVAMALPIALLSYLSHAHDEGLQACRTELVGAKAELDRLRSEAFVLTATVESSAGLPASGLDGSVVRLATGGVESVECPTRRLVNGDFTCQIRIGDLHDTFQFRVTRAGADVGYRKFTPTEPRVVMTLPDQGGAP